MFCHPERSEGSLSMGKEILRSAQDDSKDFAGCEELSRSFEPCLKFIIGCGRDTKVWLSVGFGEARFTDYPKAWPHPTESLTRMTRRSSSALMAGSSIFCQFPVPTRQRSAAQDHVHAVHSAR